MFRLSVDLEEWICADLQVKMKLFGLKKRWY